MRKRTPALTLLSLPEEVLLCVLQCLSAEDLLSVRAVSRAAVHPATPPCSLYAPRHPRSVMDRLS